MIKKSWNEIRAKSKCKMKTKQDYIYCEDCETYLDFWKYDCIEDTGHDKCNWRYVTEEELKNCINDCERDGCFSGVGE